MAISISKWLRRPEWKVKAVGAAEVTALAGLAAEVRRLCFHRSIGVHLVLLSAAVAVVAIAVDVMDVLPLPCFSPRRRHPS